MPETTNNPSHLTALRAYVAAFSRRRRWLAVVRSAGVAAAFAAGWVLACGLADRLLALSGWSRAGLLVLLAAGVSAVMVPPLLAALTRRVDWVNESRLLERQAGRFGERLLTLMGPMAGSSEFLRQIAAEASETARQHTPAELLPWRLTARPWAIAGALSLIAGLLGAFPIVGGPRVLARLVDPFGDHPEATTTQVSVRPGVAAILHGRPLRIEADVLRGGSSPVVLHSSDTGIAWTRTLMSGNGGSFAFTFPSITSDLSYFVTAGDARSPAYRVRALQTPVAQEFQVRYQLPSHTLRPPLEQVNTDGRIEAPLGTQVVLTIVASVPLKQMQMRFGAPSISLAPADAAATTWRTTFPLVAEGRYELEMTSLDGVKGVGPSTAGIRLLPDRAPVVRSDPAGDLRLGPADVLAIRYDASDDFGVQSAWLEVVVNGGSPRTLPLTLAADRRRTAGTVELDLASLDLRLGDLVTLKTVAMDGLGQATSGPVASIIVSPRSVDASTAQVILELDQSVAVAEALVQSLDRARGGDARTAGQELSAAGESAVLLRQSLLRLSLRSRSAELSTYIADAIDRTQRVSGKITRMRARQAADEDRAWEAGDPLELARPLAGSLRQVRDGQRADAVLSDLENIAAAKANARPERAASVAKVVERLRVQVGDAAKLLGIDPSASDLDGQLRWRTGQAKNAISAAQPIDFASAADRWSGDPAGSESADLQARLDIAAQTESVRRDADLLRGRDLHMSSRAVGRIDGQSTPPATQPTDPPPRTAFPYSLRLLEREHALTRNTLDRPSSDVTDQIRSAALEARRRIVYWAGATGPIAQSPPLPIAASTIPPAPASPVSPTIPTDVVGETTSASAPADGSADSESAPTDATSLALAASALAAQGDLESAERIDRQLFGDTGPEGSAARVLRQTAAAGRIRQLAGDQRQMLQQIRTLADEQLPPLAIEQRQLAEAIGDVRADLHPDRIGSPRWRDQATAVVTRVQERLAAVPGDLSELQATAVSVRAVGQTAGNAEMYPIRSDPGRVPGDNADDADVERSRNEIAEQATRNRTEASRRMADAAARVSSGVAESLLESLKAYDPLTRGSVNALADELIPALKQVDAHVRAGDLDGIAAASATARQAIGSVQEQLAEAQGDLIASDPLTAARWYASSAAALLEDRSTDRDRAAAKQEQVNVALTRAWDQTIHQAAAERLAGIPAFAGVWGTEQIGDGSSWNVGAAARLPAAREWGLLRTGPNSAAGQTTADPAGYEQSLKLYFKVLGATR